MTDETEPRTPDSRPTGGLSAQYQPGEVEQRRYERWVSEGYFTADPKSDKPPFTIVIPPPNVTGSLHVGHALDHTIQDTLVRLKRMQGYEVLWLPGMDHAGIATQNVVERQLAAQQLSRHDLGREKFVERVWEWKAESGGAILGQMRRLGDSVDWSRERFTMDEGLSRAVQTIFKRLYDDELIYRANRIINWCPRCLTALSDIEVEHTEDEGELVSIRYGEGENSIVVATTRAETMLGDTAVAVHPDDERYRHLVGTEVELPLTGRRIPIVADEHVDPSFGTGAVKVTPAHDPNDFEIGQRHGLPSPAIMDERAIITVPGPFEGLDRYEARPAIVAALREQGRIVAEKRPYLHSVGHCSRCKTTVEPRLSLQWFVNTKPLAKAAGDAVRDGRVKIEPAELSKRYFAWVDNMHDWCISRQLWWGHRIPVWYGPDGEVVCVGPDEQPPTGEGWKQDEDVLDTWFSSGLWPFSTLGWPEQTADLEKFYPTSVLVTGYDILFFWVARMMMFGLYAMDGRQPFDVVNLHGMVRDQFGKKMSKSFGNVVDPLDWIDRYGADATRFTLARGANPGSDVPVSEEWCQGSRNFCNKLWNATRFAMMNGASVSGDLPSPSELSAIDKWILSRLQHVTAEVDGYFAAYEYAKVCDALYHFAWDDVCDWYLELSKPVLAQGSAVTQRVLGHVLDQLLRLLHPVIPFVTEELWIALTGGETVMKAAWPSADPALVNDAAEEELAALQKVVTEVRRFRSDQGLKPSQRVTAALTGLGNVGIDVHEPLIRSLARLDAPGADFATTATLAVTGGITVDLDTRGAIDVAAERARLEKDRAAAEKEATQCRAKLGNEAFIGKAPEAVVAKIKDRLAAAEADLVRIAAALSALPAS
ncbi:valyl-tRNA synthetase [Actinoplanes campanulatus]|uniref:Valine--tRNA ligase n=1 Tax=Actinoplanes campanulatus TaxID=113559 RepID=A0A7W5FIW0_9ACTN|nr:valine--tRNA ligase [Actinoplanes campanulatus]MBB3100091.1 valyl-tRNA synthetase [Actinoplanes campanulatus]GGN28155.1 valine--tRNA ligase [Actinoplanes campanulatus]GID39097.1 valine--tRNA ligase [Actinoplanes campanulatus]